MRLEDTLQVVLYVVALAGLSWPLGLYMARVYEDRLPGFFKVLAIPEGMIYKFAGVDPREEMSWKTYAYAMLSFNTIGLVVTYLIQRFQSFLPLNPENLPGVTPDCSFNTAVSFASNTNWQSYSGEVTMSYLSQLLGMTVQNFVSAAAGIAMLIALIRGFARHESKSIGNFWFDLVRATLYILLPLSLVVALILVGQGSVQTFDSYKTYTPVDQSPLSDGKAVAAGKLAVGPAASQIAIKQLGTNGGGFFNVNSSHPFENPTPFSNFVECFSILIISAGLCWTFGKMIGRWRQGLTVFAAMMIIFLSFLFLCLWAEYNGNPLFHGGQFLGVGNWEGKEMRFGIANSALWATATTAASNGSVNSMHDSFTPLGGLVPMLLMQLGEVIWGGVGSGLYGMLVFAIVTVFIAGLMVGRTPEYLGKKIEAFEMKMSSLVILIPPMLVLIGTAIAVSIEPGKSSVFNPGAHGFSEILYAFSSAGNNNGSAFAGLNANTPFYNYSQGICMFFARYWLAVPVLAIAGSLAQKKLTPESAGTMRTDGVLFIALLIGVVMIFGALTFIPALALGPIVEHLQMVIR